MRTRYIKQMCKQWTYYRTDPEALKIFVEEMEKEQNNKTQNNTQMNKHKITKIEELNKK